MKGIESSPSHETWHNIQVEARISMISVVKKLTHCTETSCGVAALSQIRKKRDQHVGKTGMTGRRKIHRSGVREMYTLPKIWRENWRGMDFSPFPQGNWKSDWFLSSWEVPFHGDDIYRAIMTRVTAIEYSRPPACLLWQIHPSLL